MVADFDYQKQEFKLIKPHTSLVRGFEVFSFKEHVVSISSAELMFYHGKVNEKVKLSGFVSALFPFLKYRDLMLSDYLESIGARCSIDVSGSVTFLRIYALSTCFDDVITVVKECLFNAKLTIESFNHVKNLIIEEAKLQKKKKSIIQSKCMTRNIYSDAVLLSPDIDDVEEVDLQDVRSFFHKLKNSLGAVILLNTSEFCLDGFSNESKRSRFEVIRANKKIKLFPFIDREQSVISQHLSFDLLPVQSYAKLYIFNQAFGGCFQSVLSQEIRERQGLTYGIGTSLNFGVTGVSFSLNSTTPYGQGELVLKEVHRLLSLLHEFVDVDYLEDIKRLSIVSFLRNAEHVFSQISLFKSLFLSKHPFDYYDDLFELVKEQGINDVCSARDIVVNSPKLTIEVV